MKNTESSRFTRWTQEQGLYRAGLGIEAIIEMRRLKDQPEPLLPRVKKGGGVTSTLKYLGPLIRHGFAELRTDVKCYYLLPAGADWLAQVEERLTSNPPQYQCGLEAPKNYA
jgi:hypothetical protein